VWDYIVDKTTQEEDKTAYKIDKDIQNKMSNIWKTQIFEIPKWVSDPTFDFSKYSTVSSKSVEIPDVPKWVSDPTFKFEDYDTVDEMLSGKSEERELATQQYLHTQNFMEQVKLYQERLKRYNEEISDEMDNTQKQQMNEYVEQWNELLKKTFDAIPLQDSTAKSNIIWDLTNSMNKRLGEWIIAAKKANDTSVMNKTFETISKMNNIVFDELKKYDWKTLDDNKELQKTVYTDILKKIHEETKTESHEYDEYVDSLVTKWKYERLKEEEWFGWAAKRIWFWMWKDIQLMSDPSISIDDAMEEIWKDVANSGFLEWLTRVVTWTFSTALW